MIPTWPRTSSRWHSPPSTLPSASPRRPPVPINPDAVGTVGPENEISWTSKDSLLYALGVGAGQTNPTGFELEFTTENTIGNRPAGVPHTGRRPRRRGRGRLRRFQPRRLLHGEQHITFTRRSPPKARQSARDASPQSTTRARRHSSCSKPTFATPTATPGGPPAPASSSPAKGAGVATVGRRPPGCSPIAPPTSCTASTPAPTRRCLSPQRRPQPPALGPVILLPRRLRDPDPARPLHVRGERPGPAPRALRQRPRRVRLDGRPLQVARHPRRTPRRPHLERRRPGALPDPGRRPRVFDSGVFAHR